MSSTSYCLPFALSVGKIACMQNTGRESSVTGWAIATAIWTDSQFLNYPGSLRGKEEIKYNGAAEEVGGGPFVPRNSFPPALPSGAAYA